MILLQAFAIKAGYPLTRQALAGLSRRLKNAGYEIKKVNPDILGETKFWEGKKRPKIAIVIDVVEEPSVDRFRYSRPKSPTIHSAPQDRSSSPASPLTPEDFINSSTLQYDIPKFVSMMVKTISNMSATMIELVEALKTRELEIQDLRAAIGKKLIEREFTETIANAMAVFGR